MKPKSLRILSTTLRALQFCLVIASGLFLTTALSAAEKSSNLYSLDEYTQQIDRYIAVVNQTKSILDDPEANPTAFEQKNALCQRIQAYKSIQELSQKYLHFENAFTMKMVAELFLNKQQQSFAQSGMNETTFCGQSKP